MKQFFIVVITVGSLLLFGFIYYNSYMIDNKKDPNLGDIITHFNVPQNYVSLNDYIGDYQGKEIFLIGYLMKQEDKITFSVSAPLEDESFRSFDIGILETIVPENGNYAIKGILSSDGVNISSVKSIKIKEGIYPLIEWVAGVVPGNPQEYTKTFKLVEESISSRGYKMEDYFVTERNLNKDQSEEITLFNRNNFFREDSRDSKYQDLIIYISRTLENGEEGPTEKVKEIREVSMALP